MLVSTISLLSVLHSKLPLHFSFRFSSDCNGLLMRPGVGRHPCWADLEVRSLHHDFFVRAPRRASRFFSPRFLGDSFLFFCLQLYDGGSGYDEIIPPWPSSVHGFLPFSSPIWDWFSARFPQIKLPPFPVFWLNHLFLKDLFSVLCSDEILRLRRGIFSSKKKGRRQPAPCCAVAMFSSGAGWDPAPRLSSALPVSA